MLAVDGTKLEASASNHATRSYEQIARGDPRRGGPHRRRRGRAPRRGPRRRAARAPGNPRGPPRLASGGQGAPRGESEPPSKSRSRGSAQSGLSSAAGAWSRTGTPSAGQTATYEAYRARGVMKDGRRFGRPPDPHTPPAQPEGKINLTDPDSKNMKAYRGYVQGYNAQTVTTERQIIVAAEIAPDGLDFAQLDPMVTAAERELERSGGHRAPGGGARRRRLLVKRAHRSAPRARHHAARRPRRRPPQGAAKDAPRRALRLHAQGARNRPRARSSTRAASGWSSPSSPTSSRTGARGASNVGAGRPSARNGA